jgi:hypothetical protein
MAAIPPTKECEDARKTVIFALARIVTNPQN